MRRNAVQGTVDQFEWHDGRQEGRREVIKHGASLVLTRHSTKKSRLTASRRSSLCEHSEMLCRPNGQRLFNAAWKRILKG